MRIFIDICKCVKINIVLLLIIVGLNVCSLSSCSQKQKASEESESFENKVLNFESDFLNVDKTNAVSKDNSIQEVIEDKSVHCGQNTLLSGTANSSFYDEGYDAGYDDGEDDAVNGNGWMGQYDNSCKYMGKSRKEYEQGYEEGYEAGYDDNYELADE